MKYPQLSPSAQETARNWYRQCLAEDQDWHDATLEDWQQQLAEKGYPDAKIHYSGFSRQGDGASFECSRMDRAFPLPAELASALEQARCVAIVQRRFDGLPAVVNFHVELLVRIAQNDPHYVHQMTMGADAYIEFGDDIPEELQDKLDAWREETEKAITEESRDLATQIYDSLEHEWDYQNSDAAIEEQFTAMDYDFYRDGSRMFKHDRVAA